MEFALNSEELENITQTLVCIPTVNSSGPNHRKLAEYIASKLKSNNIEIEVIDPSSEAPIVIGWINRGAKPELHFNGHYDVVPAGEGWSVPPFDGIIKDGKVYGRGAADMKGGLASIIGAIDVINQSSTSLNGCVSLSFVPDEETGGMNGTGKLVQKDLISPDWVVIPEPTFPKILLGHKGVVQLLVKVIGSSAHAAMPALGKNAFEDMVKLSNSIINHWHINNGIIKTLFDHPTQGNALYLPTLVIGGLCYSGDAANIVPHECSFSIDRRFTSEEKCLQVRQSIEEFIRSEISNCEISRLLEIEASEMNLDEVSPLLSPLQDAVKLVFNSKAPESISAGYMDTRFFREKWNIPAVAYGPGESGSAHTVDEFVYIDRMYQVSKVFVLLTQFLLCSKLSS